MKRYWVYISMKMFFGMTFYACLKEYFVKFIGVVSNEKIPFFGVQYNAYIKTQFDYCSIIWGNSFNYDIYKMNKLQRTACKIILGKDYTYLAVAHNCMKMLSFDETVFLQKEKLMYKIVNNIAPEYLADLFQMRNANDTGSNSQSASNKTF